MYHVTLDPLLHFQRKKQPKGKTCGSQRLIETYNSKREDLEEKDQGKGERNVFLKEKRRHNYKLNH